MNNNRSKERYEAAVPTLARRGWLRAVGASAALLGLNQVSLRAADLQARARKNLKLGIMSSVYGRLPVDDAARRIKADGFSGLLCNYAFADVRFDPASPDWQAAKKILAAFDRQEIKIAAMYGYYNVVDPNLERRRRGKERMEFLIANWKRLGCPIVSTETGTFNATSEWLDAPDNLTEKGYLACRRELEGLARLAEKAGAVLTLEAYWRNIIGTIDRAERLLNEVRSPALKLVMDPCNYFRKEDISRMKPMLEDMFKRLGQHVAVAHAKDVTVTVEHPAAGKGVLDYPLYLRLLAQLDRELFLLLEHLDLSDVPRARAYVLSQFDKI